MLKKNFDQFSINNTPGKRILDILWKIVGRLKSDVSGAGDPKISEEKGRKKKNEVVFEHLHRDVRFQETPFLKDFT